VSAGQAGPDAPVVRRPEQVPARALAPGASVREMLNDEHGCRGLHQRRLSLAGDALLTGTAAGRGEAWYVIRGSGVLDAGGADAGGADAGGADAGGGAGGEGPGERVELTAGTAVWLEPGLGYRVGATGNLEVLAITVRAHDAAGPELHSVKLADCAVERTGDREFRVLLSAGLSITQFNGLIPPGRAPEHQHTYDEVVHVLAGQGVVHLGAEDTEIGPGTSIYLPPHQPHCLENTGTEPLRVLGVFYPAGSPAAKQTT
jgi:mannose-6-phosphate isomerase-like protein (cupin superfamily)